MDKSTLRKRCWDRLREAGAGRFPGIVGRIPNFVGAERAAERLVRTREFGAARTLKCNPDSPQRSLRRAALEAGKRVYVAVPRLADEHPFWELDPEWLPRGSLWKASSIQGAAELGRPVTLDEVAPIDLVVTGCVGVDRRGARLGKGGGYSDLEFALLREAGKVEAETPVVTLVHECQLVRAGTIPMEPHDQSVDLIATPERLIRCRRAFARPDGILWEHLEDEKRAAIPVLARRRMRPGKKPGVGK